MTQNKFWLVWNEAGNLPKKPHDTKEKAITEAKRLSAMYPQHAYIVLEATHHFKADVNVIETSFEATPEELSEVVPKFKVGDIVYAQCVYKKKQIKAEIRSFFNEKYCHLNVLSDDPIDKDNNSYPFSVNDLTHA